MAVQAHAPNSPGLAPEAPANGSRARTEPATPPPPQPAGPVVELVGRPTAPPKTPRHAAIDNAIAAAILPHQIHQIDQVVEIARLAELLVEKDARIALLERGLSEWRERAQLEVDARSSADRLSYERERELVGVIHQQITAIENAEESTRCAFALSDELRARIDEQTRLVESAEQNTQSALARMHELQARIDELEDLLRQRSRRWWRRRAA